LLHIICKEYLPLRLIWNESKLMKSLRDLRQGEKGIIAKIRGRGEFRKRIIEMGFVRGKWVTVVKAAPLQNPMEYRIMDSNVSLRLEEAALIDVITEEEAVLQKIDKRYNGVIESVLSKKAPTEKARTIEVALVGNPNCGKTTLFNHASRSREHVGNYAGVTIDSKTAIIKLKGYTIHITDLPGTYSLTDYSPEELFVRQHLFQEVPDVVINVVDASNLERNLYLTTQLIDMDIRVVIALNMYDELKIRGDEFDFQMLEKMTGIPFVPTIGSRGKGVKELFEKVIAVYEDQAEQRRKVHINYGLELEQSIRAILDKMSDMVPETAHASLRYHALKLLEKDRYTHEYFSQFPGYEGLRDVVNEEMDRLEDYFREDIVSLIASARYGFIEGALKETYKPAVRQQKTVTQRIDRYMTGKLLGYPIFILLMWLMFEATFFLGNYPVQWIEAGVDLLGGLVNSIIPDGIINDLIVDGIIGGVGGVIVFLPNILILFLFISLMEDTGYMARVAFIVDKLMHLIGLHGRSFIPMLMGFGCNVPAIMATRTIENRNDRMVTMLIIPFMSCSARYPVYVLLISAFFDRFQGTILFGLYLIGIMLASLMALLLKKTLFKAKEIPFVMELPPYRMPTLKAVSRHTWFKGEQYLRKMGTIILVASVIIWALGYFPMNPDREERLENSIIGRIGHFIEPVIEPLGYDWRMGVSLIAGSAAKEVVVSTMGVLYHTDAEEDVTGLTHKLRAQVYTSGPKAGKPVFTPLVAFSFMIFILIYFPCIAVIAAIKKESGNWKWAAFLAIYTTALAWLAAFAVFQVGSLVGN
jgi:ferrous iron transport protein B